MPNDFEKQVQQKMEELNFVPSEPVWTNIEKQIRKKKDRRRMILWLPLLFLLSGFGLWFFYNGSQKEKGPGTTVHQLSNNRSGEERNRTQAQASEPSIHSTNTSEEKPTTKANETPSENTESEKNNRSIGSGTKISEESIKESASITGKQGITRKINPTHLEKDDPADLNGKMNGKKTLVPNNNKADIYKRIPSTLPFDPLLQTSVEKRVDVLASPVNLVHVDSSLLANVNSEAPKSNASKWSWGLTAAAGLSGVGNGVRLFPYAATMDASYGAWPTFVSYGGPAPIKEGWSFAAGISVKRQLGKRIYLSTGLEYQYYSNSIRVGAKLYRDTVINASVVNRGAFLDARYGISNNVSVNSAYIDYRNRYHFLSLPLTMDVQILRKLPLDVNLGFSLQQLIGSKALTYESRTGVYYEDRSSLNKTQLFSHLGLNYSVLRNRSLQVGPEIQYGLSRLEKTGTNQHLFSYGVKARYLVKFK